MCVCVCVGSGGERERETETERQRQRERETERERAERTTNSAHTLVGKQLGESSFFADDVIALSDGPHMVRMVDPAAARTEKGEENEKGQDIYIYIYIYIYLYTQCTTVTYTPPLCSVCGQNTKASSSTHSLVGR